MGTIEENVKKYRPHIVRCIREPRVVSYLTVLSPDESSRLRNGIINNHEKGVNELIDLVLKSEEQGKWPAFLRAIREAEYPYVADLLENKYIHNNNDEGEQYGEYERKMIQIFSAELENQLMVDDVITRMYACKLIEDVDRKEVEAMDKSKGNAYATMVLLERMQCRKSPKQWYGQFLQILHETKYDDLVKLIEPDFFNCREQYLNGKDNTACESRMDSENLDGACCSTVNEHVEFDYMDTSASGDNMDPAPASSHKSDYLVSGSNDAKNLPYSPNKKMKLDIKVETDSDSEETNALASDGEGDSNLQLRSYQLELAERAIKGENTIICAPTGSGKTWVALHIAEKHIQTFGDRSNRKIVFMARTGALIQQQANKFREHLPDIQTSLIESEEEEARMLGDVLPGCDVLCITPQILINNLDSGSLKSLTQFSLLILDECHHTRGDEPYSVLMKKYMVEKYDASRNKDLHQLPQIVGLTASIGIGKKAYTDVEARDYIMSICALMDVKRLSIVKKCKEELRKYTCEPEEEIIPMSRLYDDPGKDILLKVIEETEVKLKGLAFLEPAMIELVQKKCPKSKGSQAYNKWTVDVTNATYLSNIRNQVRARNIRACANNLYIYNQALEVNDLLQNTAVMSFLADKHTFDSQETDKDKFTEVENELLSRLQDVLQKLGSIEKENENPNLRNLSKTLSQMLENDSDDSCAMVFVKARVTCKALASFLKDDLNDIEVKPLYGKDNRGEEGMTREVQDDTIRMFREGDCKVLVTTSIGLEGIDVPACNMVLNYSYTGNEITKVQMKGRIRTHEGRHVIMGDDKLIRREKVNLYKEAIMQRAIQLYEDLPLKTIENKTTRIQKEEMKSFMMKKELEKTKRRNQTNTGDYEICCKYCNAFVCFLSNVREMERHHCVIDTDFTKSVKTKPLYPPINYDGYVKKFKFVCNVCPKELGGIVEKNGAKFYLLKFTKLKFINRETSKFERYKTWTHIPVRIQTMTLEDIQNLVDQNADA